MTSGLNSGLEFGARVLPDGQVRFRFWAPAQQTVSVAVEDGELFPMQRSPDGWFEVVASCPVGTRYRYRLADGMLVPDPASRAQAGCVHDPSIVIDPDAYRWRCAGWRGLPWVETVLYEIHPGTAGGFDGIARMLPDLKDVGVTAIELMPIADFPGRHNWGYDGVLPYAPDAAYGTPDQLKSLVDAAHALGLMIFLDVVYNHFGPDGNYLHAYAPDFFRDDIHTPWGSAIDFRRPEVRAFFTGNVLQWLIEYRFDGLRFDAVHAIAEQDWITEMTAIVRASVEPGREVHLVLEHHNNAQHLLGDVDAQWNDDGHNVLHVLLTGETSGYYADYADAPAEKLARVLDEGWVYQGEMSSYLGHARGERSAELPPTAHVLFLQNHDQTGNRAFGERLTALADPAALEAAIALLLLCPQVPLLFMGEEDASRTPFLFFTDHNDELAEAVRNGRRQEFAHFPAFADPNQRERIPDPNDPATFAASVPMPDPTAGPARRALYRELLALRRQHIMPRLAGARSAGASAIGSKAVFARWLLGDSSILSIATNLAVEPVAFTAPSGTCLFTSCPASDRAMQRLPGRCTTVFLELQA
jgi:malto-oligosyltrehalose trehalohydrolase